MRFSRAAPESVADNTDSPWFHGVLYRRSGRPFLPSIVTVSFADRPPALTVTVCGVASTHVVLPCCVYCASGTSSLPGALDEVVVHPGVRARTGDRLELLMPAVMAGPSADASAATRATASHPAALPAAIHVYADVLMVPSPYSYWPRSTRKR